MEAPTDEQLLQEYLAGNASSFELLVRRHVQELHQFALRFAGSAVAAEDVVQETFLQVHTSAASFDTARRFKPWLFTIAANKARDFLRKRGRRRELPFDAQLDREEDTGRQFIHLLSGNDDSVDGDLLVNERRRTVKEAVQAMPTKLSEVLILAYYHRLSYREIADIVGIPLGTVKSRLHAAIASFRNSYQASAKKRQEHEP